MQDEFTFGETKVVQKTSHATLDEILAIAKKIWKKIAESKISINDTEGSDKLLEVIQVEFKDFNSSFPLILRWMVQMRKFSQKVFKKYLLKHSTTKLDTKKSFLELQAEYLVLLFREDNKHVDEKIVRNYRDCVVTQLLEEDKEFEKVQKQVEAEYKQQETSVDVDRRQRLYAYLLSQKIKS